MLILVLGMAGAMGTVNRDIDSKTSSSEKSELYEKMNQIQHMTKIGWKMARQMINCNIPERYAAIRSGKWKLIEGTPGMF